MTTGSEFVNVTDKCILGSGDLKDRFLDQLHFAQQMTIKSQWDVDGVFNTKLTLSGPSADTVQVNGTSWATDGDGHLLDVDNIYPDRTAEFENSNSILYYVGMHYALRPAGIRINPRTGQPEYVKWIDSIGESGTPDVVVDNGTNITFTVNSITESGVDCSGREVLVYLNTPAEGATSESIALEECTVAYASSNNTITTTGLLGQSVVSTTASDYTVVLLGISVKRNTDLESASGYMFVGTVTGNGGTPSVFNTDDQRVLKTFQDASQITFTPYSWITAADVQAAIEQLADRHIKHVDLLPWHGFAIADVDYPAGHNTGIFSGDKVYTYQGYQAATISNPCAFYFEVCSSTVCGIRGTGSNTVIEFWCDYITGDLANVVDSVQLSATDYSDAVINARTTITARADLDGDGDTPWEHFSTSLWVAENWAASGYEGNLHYVEFDDTAGDPSWSVTAKTSPFGGIGGDNTIWQGPNAKMAHRNTGGDGVLVAVARPVASGGYYVNVSTDLGSTWSGRSDISAMDDTTDPILLQYSDDHGGWVLCDSNGHIFICTSDPSNGSNWVKQDSVAAASAVHAAFSPGGYKKAVLVPGSRMIVFTVEGDNYYAMFTDDYWDSYISESRWTKVYKIGSNLGYIMYDGSYLWISHPVFTDGNVTDQVTPP